MTSRRRFSDRSDEQERLNSKFERAIELLGKRWTWRIIHVLIERPRRFGEIVDLVSGLSDRLLSERLQEMEEAGIVTRVVKPLRPIVVEYSLTNKGASIKPILDALELWADRWIPDEGSRRPQKR